MDKWEVVIRERTAPVDYRFIVQAEDHVAARQNAWAEYEAGEKQPHEYHSEFIRIALVQEDQVRRVKTEEVQDD